MRKEDPNYSSKSKRIGYLKKVKSRMEFRISTESSSLAQEKEMIRGISEISKELDEALASVRMERKIGFITKDIDDYRKAITEVNSQIVVLDTRLDNIYVALRKTLGIGSWRSKPQQAPKRERPAPAPGVNLEDIAVIKKKDSK
ncbi:MAG: hypothetical protein ACREBH_01700 [Candidatus Micrarchaeaceae archaeon]